jgi:flavin reductase (DIM6/NTAB) family NADH-FMN oxidoreductase RutF
MRAGDHTLFVGRVSRLNSGSAGALPLTYHRGRFISAGPPTGEWPLSITDAWAGSLRSGWG